MDFKEVEKKVKEIINGVDPDNLVGSGAPEDEYLTQVHKIISVLLRTHDQELWEKEIFNVFFPKPEYNPVDAKDKIARLNSELKTAFPEGIKVS